MSNGSIDISPPNSPQLKGIHDQVMNWDVSDDKAEKKKQTLAFINDASESLGVMSTNGDVFEFMFKAQTEYQDVPEFMKETVMQTMNNMRQEVRSMMSNLLRSFHESARSVISNMRP